MSWEALLFIAFLLLPMLQGLVQRKAPPRLPPPDREREVPDDGAGWSEGWGEWAHEENSSTAAEPEHSPLSVQPTADSRATATLEAAPETTVVSLEPLAPRPLPARTSREVAPDRTAEHARFHTRVAVSTPPPRPAAHHERLRLRTPGELRRAVLLSEVLGAPRALRPLEAEKE